MRNVALGSQRRKKRLDFSRTHLPGVALAVKNDVTFDPLGVGFLGTSTVVQGTDYRPHLVQKSGFLSGAMFVKGN